MQVSQYIETILNTLCEIKKKGPHCNFTARQLRRTMLITYSAAPTMDGWKWWSSESVGLEWKCTMKHKMDRWTLVRLGKHGSHPHQVHFFAVGSGLWPPVDWRGLIKLQQRQADILLFFQTSTSYNKFNILACYYCKVNPALIGFIAHCTLPSTPVRQRGCWWMCD